jgi:signal transduction histidine kinase
MISRQSNSSFHSSLPQRIFQTLSIRHLLALSLIALTILASNWFVMQKLEEQSYDAHLLSLAGEQTTLGQQLVKSALLINTDDQQLQQTYQQELATTINQLEQSHRFLIQAPTNAQRSFQSSDTIRRLFNSIDPAYRALLQHGRALAASENNLALSLRSSHIRELLEHESAYLKGMHAIVQQFEKEAQQRVDQLVYMQQFLTYLSLSIIVLLIVFVFRPVARFVKKFLVILSRSRAQAKELVQERQMLFASLEKSHKYLSNMHFAVERATLFARIDCNGRLLYTSSQFRQRLHLPHTYSPYTLPELLQISSDDLRSSLDQVREQGYCCVDWACSDYLGRALWLTVTVVPLKDDQNELHQYLFLCIDVTEKKQAIEQLHIANRKNLKQKIREQRMRSVLVLQAQEEERKRIAMDLHDNVGQSLTALKYNVEALAPLATEDRLQQRLDYIGQLLRESIAKVRQTSFHLMPSVLSDYGLGAVLRNFAQEMKRLTGRKIYFINHSNFNQRLDEHVETNLYRIVQESLTNALKYAQATQISISLRHNDTTLWVAVTDNGVGFSASESTFPSGRGLSNMEERTKYLHGKFTVESTVGKGTKVMIQVPLSYQKEIMYDNYRIG